MRIAALDFETYYDKEYSLSKMTYEEYINDPRYETIGVSITEFVAGENPPPAVWYPQPEVEERLNETDWSRTALLAHNTVFDGSILHWRYGHKPKFYLDTISMARPFHSVSPGLSLAKLVKHYGLGEKGTEVVNALGLRFAKFPAYQLAAYGGYCCNDTDLTTKLFYKLLELLPPSELEVIDQTLRMYIEPILCLDRELVERELELEKARIDALMEKTDADASVFRSDQKFAELLESLGVEPPRKLNSKGKSIFAFAKTDADFIALKDHDDPVIVAAVEARLGARSTLKQTRAARFLGIHDRCDGKLPVALGYYNAHTGRYGAFDKQNLQNLNRVKKKDPNSGLLRRAITAPPGHQVVVADLSQIEARLLVWQANQLDKVEAFAQKRDVYSEQASVIYGRHVDRRANPEDFTPGFVGKCVTLGCGYGLGYPKFSKMIYVGMLGEKGVTFDGEYVDALGVDIHGFATRLRADRREQLEELRPVAMDEADWLQHCAVGSKIISVYRADNDRVVAYWDIASQALVAMLEGREMSFGGPNGDLLVTQKDAILLPNGMQLRYEGLEYDQKENEFSFMRRKTGRVMRVKVYGGAVVENVTQALARIVITDVMRLAKKHGLRTALQVHDELVLAAPDRAAEVATEALLAWMSDPPAWAKTLPLAAEGSFSFRYGDAK